MKQVKEVKSLRLKAKSFKSVGVIRNSSFYLLRQICVLYTIHLSILYSYTVFYFIHILYFSMAVQLTLPILVA